VKYPYITLTTDFGLSDPYVGQIRAAILGIAPDAKVIDLTHGIAPQAVSEAAFVLDSTRRFLPPDSAHVVVVDPGVGTSRRRLAIESGGNLYVGPDNGCLSAALPDKIRGARAPGSGYDARTVRLPDGVQAYSVERLDELLPRKPSVTFEGRDIFAPVAALISVGRAAAADFGPRVREMLAFPAFRAPFIAGRLEGIVLRSDHFGNLITDIPGEALPAGAVVEVAGEVLPVSRTYAEAGGLTAVIGSSGYLEVALPNGNAAAALAAGPGASVALLLP
jgi:S-adenosylmethionine hydrolase